MQRAQIVLSIDLLRPVDHGHEDRRHEREIRRLVLPYRRQHLAHLELGENDDRRPVSEQPGGERRQAVDVKHRDRADESLLSLRSNVRSEPVHDGLHHRDKVPVRRHNSFAHPGGSGRVKQSRRVVLVNSLRDSGPTRLPPHHLRQPPHLPRRVNSLLVHEHDREPLLGSPRRGGDLGEELRRGEGHHGVRVFDLFGDLGGGVERVRGGDDGAEGHHGETDDGEQDGVRGEEKDDVALADPHVGETVADGLHGAPQLGEGEVFTGGGVDEGGTAEMSLRGYESGDVEGRIRRERNRLPFAVESRVRVAEATSRIH